MYECVIQSVELRRIARMTKDRPRFHDTLDVIKFVCKEFWLSIFKKQIDNLKTNHRVRCLLFVHCNLS